jgi:arylsulfatase A-like enzyme
MPTAKDVYSMHQGYAILLLRPQLISTTFDSISIRTRQWKYIFSSGKHDLWSYETGNGAPGRYQHLYHVIEDPQEFHNLADDPRYAKVVKELRQRMLNVFMTTDPRAAKIAKTLSVEEQLEWFLEPPEKKGS